MNKRKLDWFKTFAHHAARCCRSAPACWLPCGVPCPFQGGLCTDKTTADWVDVFEEVQDEQTRV